MDPEIPKRLAIALAAKGINMKQAGLAAGLNSNYVRDVIRRGRGKFELLERVAEANGLSWLWIKTEEGEMDAPRATPKSRVDLTRIVSAYGRERVELFEVKERASGSLRSPEPAREKLELPIDILVNRDALVHAFRMFGASEDQATKAVELVSGLANSCKENFP